MRWKATTRRFVIPQASVDGWLYLNVKDKDGKIQNWAVETGAPAALIRRGGDKKTLAIGTELIVDSN